MQIQLHMERKKEKESHDRPARSTKPKIKQNIPGIMCVELTHQSSKDENEPSVDGEHVVVTSKIAVWFV